LLKKTTLVKLSLLFLFSLNLCAQNETELRKAYTDGLKTLLSTIDVTQNKDKIKFMDALQASPEGKSPYIGYVSRTIIKYYLVREPNEIKIWQVLDNASSATESSFPGNFPSSKIKGLTKKWEDIKAEVKSGAEDEFYVSEAHKKALLLYLNQDADLTNDMGKADLIEKIMAFKLTTAQKRQLLKELIKQDPSVNVIKQIINTNEIENVPASEVSGLYESVDKILVSARELRNSDVQVNPKNIEQYTEILHPDVSNYLDEESNKYNAGVTAEDKNKIRDMMTMINNKIPYNEIKSQQPNNIDVMRGELSGLFEIRLNNSKVSRIYYCVDVLAGKVYYLYAESKQGQNATGTSKHTADLLIKRFNSREIIEDNYNVSQEVKVSSDVQVAPNFSIIDEPSRAYKTVTDYTMYRTVFRKGEGAFREGIIEKINSAGIYNILNATDDICKMLGIKTPVRYPYSAKGSLYNITEGDVSSDYLAVRGLLDGSCFSQKAFSILPLVTVMKLVELAGSDELKAIAEKNGLKNLDTINIRLAGLQTKLSTYSLVLIESDAKNRLLIYTGLSEQTSDAILINTALVRMDYELTTNDGKFSPETLSVISRDDILYYLKEHEADLPFSVLVAKNYLVDLLQLTLEVKNYAYDEKYYIKPEMTKIKEGLSDYKALLK